ncbi:MAG: YdcF family protein [Spirochaetia bacterium]|nr:YdcF family protein [Spirochaetia bacterium]
MKESRARLPLRVFALWFTLHTAYILYDGFNDRIEKTDVALVFGNKVEESGVPSERLERRLQRSLDLYKEGFVSLVVVSGGLGVEGHDEAAVMREWLIQNGVPQSAIIQDSAGKDSIASARRYAELSESRNWMPPIVVTDYFHITRSKLALRLAGVHGAFSAHAPLRPHIKELYYIPREFFAFYYYLLKY